jgi:hypothetical protein
MAGLTFPLSFSMASVPSLTYATLPAANAVPAGTVVRATNLGEHGTLLISTGTRWRTLTGEATLKQLGNAVSGIANSENIVLQTLLPAGSWQTNDVIRIKNLSVSKSGTTDTGNLTVRVGTAGTTADTAITGISALTAVIAANQSFGAVYDIKLVSATSALKLGGNTVAPFAGGSTAAAAAATAITDASANALYVSVGLASSGATNTVGIQSGQIALVTP